MVFINARFATTKQYTRYDRQQIDVKVGRNDIGKFSKAKKRKLMIEMQETMQYES